MIRQTTGRMSECWCREDTEYWTRNFRSRHKCNVRFRQEKIYNYLYDQIIDSNHRRYIDLLTCRPEVHHRFRLWTRRTCKLDSRDPAESLYNYQLLWTTADISTHWRVVLQSMKNSDLPPARLRTQCPSFVMGNLGQWNFLSFRYPSWIFWSLYISPQCVLLAFGS